MKKEKKVKLVSGKKLPKLFKKSYSEKALEKKIYKKLYIPSDLEFVKALFAKTKNKKGKEVWTCDVLQEYSKDDVKRYKKLAKQIKQNKGGFKAAPFIAVVVTVAAIGISVTLFKNVLVKKALTTGLESAFGTKAEIQKVDFQIFGASLEVDGISQLSSSNPAKNMFEIEQVKMSFNLSDLLKGKFHAEDLVVTGVALDTDRKVAVAKKTSAPKKEAESTEKKSKAEAKKESAKKETAAKPEKQLSEKEAAKLAEKNAKAAEKTAKKEAEAAAKKSKSEAKKDGLKNNASEQLEKMFANYNPENLLSSIQDELKSPKLAASISNDVQEKIEKWQNVPGQYEKSVSELSKNVDALVKTDWSKMYDVKKITETINTISSTIKESDELKKKIEKTCNEIKVDSQLVSSYQTQIQNAISSDLKIVDVKVNEMKGLFSVSGLQNIMNEAVTSMLYSVLGDKAPYFNKAVAMAKASATGKSSKSVKEEKAKSKSRKRSAGRTIYYRKDTVPKILIENAKGSGYEYNSDKLLFSAVATEISSDQNMRGKPTKINADFNLFGAANNAKIVVDSREASKAPLISADYSGKGYPVSADVEIFKLESKSNILASMTATDEGKVVLKGTLDMAVSKMEGMSFEPVIVADIYKKSLAGVKKLTLAFEAEYSNDDGFKVKLVNPEVIGKQIVQPITNALTNELNSIIAGAKQEVANVIAERTGIATDKISEFAGIENILNGQASDIFKMQNLLKNTQNQLNKQANNAAKAAADEVKRQAEEAAKKAADEAKRQAEEAAKKAAEEAANQAADTVKNLFGW